MTPCQTCQTVILRSRWERQLWHTSVCFRGAKV